ncbi:MAG TPA: hypothetical protein VGY55_19865 [Pirellulales bacterium]|jgi:hypothetical protein|nr:hypothetical protein [Pirellulales bacterium]
MSSDVDRIPAEVADKLGYYVYLLVDPRDGHPFYVGKGKGSRVISHLRSAGESRKNQKLADLASHRLKPRLEIISHGLESEVTAFRVEAAVIDAIPNLTNQIRGIVHGIDSVKIGRLPLEDVICYYGAKEVSIDDPVILLRINHLYYHGITDDELYDAMRRDARGVSARGVAERRSTFLRFSRESCVKFMRSKRMDGIRKARPPIFPKFIPLHQIARADDLSFGESLRLRRFERNTDSNPCAATCPKARSFRPGT